jgi:hypothetical protein
MIYNSICLINKKFSKVYAGFTVKTYPICNDSNNDKAGL